MQKLCCVRTRQHSLPVWIISSQTHHHISTNSQPFLVGIVSLDTLRGTIELPAHRKLRLHNILTETLQRKRVSVPAWQRLLGELQSMIIGIPGGQGLFSQLQVALQQQSHHRVRIHKEAKACLQDLYMLAQDLAQRPTCMAEIVPTHPLYAGCCDASRAGMGGVWLPSPDPYYPQHPPYVWQAPFSPQIQRALITTTNPSGTITNSDLELAGTIRMLAPWLTTGTYGNAQSPYSRTTLLPSSGALRPPLPPRDLQLTCSAPRVSTSGAIGTSYNTPTSPVPLMC